jgi:hypothetical protein
LAGGKLCVGARLVDDSANGFDDEKAFDDEALFAVPKPLLFPEAKALLAGDAPNWNMLLLRLPPCVGSCAFFSCAAAAPKLNCGVALKDVVGCGADPKDTAGDAPNDVEGDAPNDTEGEAPKDAGGFAPKDGLCVEVKAPVAGDPAPAPPDGGKRRFGVLILADWLAFGVQSEANSVGCGWTAVEGSPTLAPRNVRDPPSAGRRAPCAAQIPVTIDLLSIRELGGRAAIGRIHFAGVGSDLPPGRLLRIILY